MGINLWGCCRGRQAHQHRDAFTEQGSASSPLHLHSLQRPAPEFEVPASIFADFRGKGSFGLDQEMSLLSHVELNAEAKWEDCAGEARTCSKPLLLVERPSLRSHSCLELLQPSGSSLSAVSFRHSLDGGSRRLPGFQGCNRPTVKSLISSMSSAHHCISFSKKTQLNFLWSTGWTSDWANKLVRKGHAVAPGSLPCCLISTNRWDLRAFSGTKAGGIFNLLYMSKQYICRCIS